MYFVVPEFFPGVSTQEKASPAAPRRNGTSSASPVWTGTAPRVSALPLCRSVGLADTSELFAGRNPLVEPLLAKERGGVIGLLAATRAAEMC